MLAVEPAGQHGHMTTGSGQNCNKAMTGATLECSVAVL